MKRRTFTVLFTDEYDEGNGVEMTDEQAIRELAENLQSAYDGDVVPLGGNFLVIAVEDGDDRFWSEWNERLRRYDAARNADIS